MKIHLIAVLLIVMLPSRAWPQEKMYVLVPAIYDATAPVGQRIKDECAIEVLVGNHVYAAVNKQLPESLMLKNPGEAGDGKVLQLTVLSVIGHGGGGWSGSKSITIRADLMREGKVLKSSVHQDHSRGGWLGSGVSTCYIFERVAKALGGKVAGWLVKPTEGMQQTADPVNARD